MSRYALDPVTCQPREEPPADRRARELERLDRSDDYTPAEAIFTAPAGGVLAAVRRELRGRVRDRDDTGFCPGGVI